MLTKKLFVATAAIVLCFLCERGDAEVVTYFQNAGFGGDQNTLDMTRGTCYNLSFFNDRMSSINTHGNCVTIYIESNCHGASFNIKPGTDCHSNLGQCGMNDKVSSLQLC